MIGGLGEDCPTLILGGKEYSTNWAVPKLRLLRYGGGKTPDEILKELTKDDNNDNWIGPAEIDREKILKHTIPNFNSGMFKIPNITPREVNIKGDNIDQIHNIAARLKNKKITSLCGRLKKINLPRRIPCCKLINYEEYFKILEEIQNEYLLMIQNEF